MLQGLRTVLYYPGNMDEAKAWYSRLLGYEPYFDEPFYVGFNVGGYELGLDPDSPRPDSSTGVMAYWGVQNIDLAYEKILQLGAKPHKPITDVGDSIRLASVIDPFGNIVGLIENPHFKVQEK